MLLGNFAYVAADSAGLEVIDISNPLAPILVGSFRTQGVAWSVKVRGSIVYAAAGLSGLEAIDVTNPARPTLLGSLSLPGTSKGLDVDLSRNVVAVVGDQGLFTANVSNPVAPTLLGSLNYGGFPQNVALNGNFAFVADSSTSLTSVDLTNPATPVRGFSTDPNLGGELYEVAISNGFALGGAINFINTGVTITDISNPPSLLSRAILSFVPNATNGFRTFDKGTAIAADGTYVYLTTDQTNGGAQRPRNGVSDDSRLYIGQYLALIDNKGIPPIAAIASPANGATVIAGSLLPIAVNATDDVAVAAVNFLVNGRVAFTATSSPYQFNFRVPVGISTLKLSANAVDVGGNVGTAADVILTVGLFGAGYLEMLARQMTAELQVIRDSLKLGETKPLIAKGVSFGQLTRRKDGSWDTSKVEGLPRLSIIAPTPVNCPSLILRPWHQASNVVSLREFSNTAFNQHHGMQSSERFGADSDPDGDGVKNELTRADITAVTLFQAEMAVPGQVVPNDPEIEQAVLNGEKVFAKIGCSSCHIPKLPLDNKGWIYTEPNPYNPPTNLRLGTAKTIKMDLNSTDLPLPRLAPDPEHPDVVWVPAFTDFKLHDICDPNDPGEPLDQNQTPWTKKFRQGNRRFLTKRLWGSANEPPFFHHGLFTTLRRSVLAHSGEALESRKQFNSLKKYDQDSLIEFLKSLQALPPGTASLNVDENFRPKRWPPLATSGSVKEAATRPR